MMGNLGNNICGIDCSLEYASPKYPDKFFQFYGYYENDK